MNHVTYKIDDREREKKNREDNCVQKFLVLLKFESVVHPVRTNAS